MLQVSPALSQVASLVVSDSLPSNFFWLTRKKKFTQPPFCYIYKFRSKCNRDREAKIHQYDNGTLAKKDLDISLLATLNENIFYCNFFRFDEESNSNEALDCYYDFN